ncbi:MAG: hypothetical protein KDA96_00610, partial [Planctomycetaceae bacterium]|nr:hypothetical protein [Planctomycetaceae bacterium]
MTSFIHPYNFVRLPDVETMRLACEAVPFQRRPSETHDSFGANLQSGWIECELTTKSQWFIPDARKITSHRDHK